MEGLVLRPQVRRERNACLRCALEYLEHTIALVETQVDLGELDPRRLALLDAPFHFGYRGERLLALAGEPVEISAEPKHGLSIERFVALELRKRQPEASLLCIRGRP